MSEQQQNSNQHQ